MPAGSIPKRPSDAELATLDERIARLLADREAVPRSNRIRLTGGKLASPIAKTTLPAPTRSEPQRCTSQKCGCPERLPV